MAAPTFSDLPAAFLDMVVDAHPACRRGELALVSKAFAAVLKARPADRPFRLVLVCTVEDLSWAVSAVDWGDRELASRFSAALVDICDSALLDLAWDESGRRLDLDAVGLQAASDGDLEALAWACGKLALTEAPPDESYPLWRYGAERRAWLNRVYHRALRSGDDDFELLRFLVKFFGREWIPEYRRFAVDRALAQYHGYASSDEEDDYDVLLQDRD
jgi:hypothetical protein